MLRHYNSLIIFIGAIIILFSCGNDASTITDVVERVCRSRIEGDSAVYAENIGGIPLLQYLRNPAVQRAFEQEAANHNKNGVLFVDIYIRDIHIDAVVKQAEVFFIEKWSQGSRTVTRACRWGLESIDGQWRVIRF